MRSFQKRQISKDLSSPKKIRGLDDLMAELVLDHPEWKSRGEKEPGIKSKKVKITRWRKTKNYFK